ncbi:hypothetical protein roselon_00689 [Roseibacterium elongatum DSM 19469]|uniref:DUF304 domain-containing protein n=1 Tax=Roseicyclus elongatus DSM 19469 TaxID=1294273 RepID=W8RPZ7_9RHOB|nr:hypothetical protein [Roseibacterium elongatum]AHM03118.1 hypothetical protein roselon_00689 [Roseibacterium elongatum DSM 19469]
MDPTATRTQFTSTTVLEDGEAIVASFQGDRATYWREHAWLAAIAMAAGMGLLWAMGNPHVWTGAIGGLAAIAVRGLYLASDETKMRWDLTDRRLLGPGPRVIWLRDVETVRSIFSAVQVVTRSGDKYLLKYQPDTERVIADIDGARARRGV